MVFVDAQSEQWWLCHLEVCHLPITTTAKRKKERKGNKHEQIISYPWLILGNCLVVELDCRQSTQMSLTLLVLLRFIWSFGRARKKRRCLDCQQPFGLGEMSVWVIHIKLLGLQKLYWLPVCVEHDVAAWNATLTATINCLCTPWVRFFLSLNWPLNHRLYSFNAERR